MNHPLSAIGDDRRGTQRMRTRGPKKFNRWHLIAAMIRDIPDADVRTAVANHATQYFTRHVAQFDAGSFAGATGGSLTGASTLAR